MVMTIGKWALCVGLLALSAVSSAQPVALFQASDQATAAETVDAALVLRQRFAKLVRNALSEDTGQIELNLFDDVSLVATSNSVESGHTGGLTWTGQVDGYLDSDVTLVVGAQSLSATISLPDVIYHVRPAEDDDRLLVIREIDRFALEPAPVAAPTQSRRLSIANARIAETEESAVLGLVNQERAVRGLKPLKGDNRLAAAARSHSRDMSQRNYFSHTGQDGRSAGQRMSAQGYSWNAWGENIAAGQRTPAAVMNGWMNSPGHRANILNTTFCDIGVGHFSGSGRYGIYWTQNFGRLRGVSSCPAGPTNPPPPPPANSAPSLSAVGAQNSREGMTVALGVNATDSNGDSLRFSATGLPRGLAIGAGSGLISGTLAAGSRGNYRVTVTVNDGRGGTDSTAFNWTVTASSPPPNPPPASNIVLLRPGVTDNGQYGHQYGSNAHRQKLVLEFARTGADMDFSVTGYDVDFSNELSVYLNGRRLGYLSKGANNRLNGGNRFAIAAARQINGTNRIEIRQRVPGWIWGVTNLRLSTASQRTITLTVGSTDNGQYGHRYGSNQHRAELLATFPGSGAALTLTVTGYDIDFNNEVQVLLNGRRLGYLKRGPNNQLTAVNQFRITPAQQVSGANRLQFKQRVPGWIWGVTRLRLNR